MTSTCATRPQRFPHVFTEGDRLPEIVGTLDGVDLTGYTIDFDLLRPDNVVIQKSTATSGVAIVDGPNGMFSISWSETDLLEGKDQAAQVRFIDPAGLPMTSQDFLITVKARQRS